MTNIYEHRTGKILTPLMTENIQYAKIKQVNNMEQVRNKLITRGLGKQFDATTNWTGLIKLLKDNGKETSNFIHVLTMICSNRTRHTSMPKHKDRWSVNRRNILRLINPTKYSIANTPDAPAHDTDLCSIGEMAQYVS